MQKLLASWRQTWAENYQRTGLNFVLQPASWRSKRQNISMTNSQDARKVWEPQRRKFILSAEIFRKKASFDSENF